MMINSVRSTITLILCCVLTAGVFAQSNPSVQDVIILKDTEYTSAFYSHAAPNIAVYPSAPYDSLSLNAINGTDWELFYKPATGYTGRETIVIEYFDNDPGSGYPPRYVVYSLEVNESIILCEDDFELADKNNSTPVEIAVLANDSATHAPLELVSLAMFSNGTAEITDSNTILFIPNIDFEGEANIKYVVEDNLGNRNAGNVSIYVRDPGLIEAADTIHISSTMKSPAIIQLPFDGFVVDTMDVPNLGSVEFKSGVVAEFRPHPGASGLDTFQLVKGSEYIRTVFAQVLISDAQNGIAKDDRIYTAEATPVSFNVFENDLQDTHPVVSYTSYPGFVHDSAGWFTYTPPSWYAGVRNFSYTIDNGYYEETAKISIHVSDFDPNTGFTYNLKTHKNTPLIINYNIPLEEFDFSVHNDANFGDVEVYSGIQTLYTECDSVTGLNLIEYVPDEDYTGLDYFEIEYCPTSNPCVIAKINMEVIDFYDDPETCACVNDCVWEGDTDHDGTVSVIDLLPVGYYLGASGPVREDSISSFTWYGETAANWNGEQFANGQNLKHIDSDGDGIITEFDADAINAYYSLSHTLTPPQELDLKDYPFILDFLQDTVYAGDLLQIAIHIGNSSYPAKDINGFAFGLSIPSFLIDSSSAQMYFEQDGWFTSNSGSLGIFRQPLEGIIETAYTRTVQTPVSGFGKVAQFDFIVEEDLIGIKTGKYIELTPDMLFNRGISDEGKAITLPFETNTVIVALERPENPILNESDLIVFPNPASEMLTMHVNRGHLISSYDLINMMGLRMASDRNLDTEHLQINVNSLPEGTYVLRVQTDAGLLNRIVEIVRP